VAADFFRGSADWEKISEIKQHLQRIPLIGNGDLDSPAKVIGAFNRYAVDGVMIARASLGRPWLFQQCAAALRGEPVPPDPTIDEQRAWMLRHYELVCERFGEDHGTMLMRKFACNYATGKAGARHFRNAVGRVCTRAEFFAVVEDHFPRHEDPQQFLPPAAQEAEIAEPP
jgi:tRNA-dihydrouridine synthase B